MLSYRNNTKLEWFIGIILLNFKTISTTLYIEIEYLKTNRYLSITRNNWLSGNFNNSIDNTFTFGRKQNTGTKEMIGQRS